MSKFFKKAKATIKLLKMANYSTFENVEIPEIPTKWSKFLDTEDEWIRVDLPESEESTTCLYKAKAGSLFPPHKHVVDEQLMILKGTIEVITKDGEYELSYPKSCLFKRNEVHAVKFITDTTILVNWNPTKNNNWAANFTDIQHEL